MDTALSPILVTCTPADVVRGWIGQASRAGLSPEVVPRMADALGGTIEDVHAIARGSLPHLGQLLDGDLVQRLAGSVGASPLDLAYRSVLRYDSTGAPEPIEDDEDKPQGYRFVMSDAQPDRADDIVEQGWDLREFIENPVAPYNHNYSAPPIGRWEDVAVEGGVLRGTLIPTPVQSYPLSLTVAALLEAGTLRTCSVGFRPSAVLARSSLPEDDPRYADRGYVYALPRLLECSPTPMPMNPRAARLRTTDAAPVKRSVPSGLPWSPSPLSSGLPWT